MKSKWLVIDFMVSELKWFEGDKAEEEARDYFEKEKKGMLERGEECDIVCLEVKDEYNNVS